MKTSGWSRAARPEGPRKHRALHEPARARRLDELVAERGVELAQSRHDHRRLLAIGPVLERSLRLAQVDLRSVGRIRVELEREGGVLPLPEQAYSSATNAVAVLVFDGASLEELILGILVGLVLALDVSTERKPVGGQNPRPECFPAKRVIDGPRRFLLLRPNGGSAPHRLHLLA